MDILMSTRGAVQISDVNEPLVILYGPTLYCTSDVHIDLFVGRSISEQRLFYRLYISLDYIFR